MTQALSSSPKKAPLIGAFFVLLVHSTLALSTDRCAPPANAEPVRIRFVSDGDTLILGDNRKIRLIGINTPEIGRDGQPSEPLALRARDQLRQWLLASGNRAKLSYGPERQDRYGRVPAHVWLADGRNLGAELLRAGLGWAIAISPNVKLLTCYRNAEQAARSAKTGLWTHTAYRDAEPSQQLTLRSRGFRRVRGRITGVASTGNAIWISLQGRLTVRIDDRDRKWFKQLPEHSWVGRELEVRGWLYGKKGELRVNISHPFALELH